MRKGDGKWKDSYAIQSEARMELMVYKNKKFLITGLPWWLSGEEAICQCRRHRFDPWSRRTAHAAEQLSLCPTTTHPCALDPGSSNDWAHVPHVPWSPCSLLEKPRPWEARVPQLGSSLHLLQLEELSQIKEDPAEPKKCINKIIFLNSFIETASDSEKLGTRHDKKTPVSNHVLYWREQKWKSI